MKRILLLASVALIGATSCSDEIIVQQNENNTTGSVELSFQASTEEREGNMSTRTLVREGSQTFWVANDRISLFAGSTSTTPYSFITKDGGIVANYKGTVGETASFYCALYPHNSKATLSNYVFTTVLYTQQYAEPDSYASGMNVAVTRSYEADAQDLNFANSASYLRVLIPDDYSGKTITSMELSGNNGELIAGDITTSAYSKEDAAAKVIDNENASTTIYLNQINAGASFIPGKSYYFVLAPTNMTKGYTLRFVYDDGTTGIMKEEPFNFERNHVHVITVREDEEGEELCASKTEDGLFRVTDLNCLYEWAELVAEGESSLGCYLMNDIDFEGDERKWPQIGTDEAPFSGRIMGNGKTISNFKVENGQDEYYTGFVAVMDRGGSVENLTFENPVVKSTHVGDVTVTSDDGYVGVIVGRLNESHMFNYTTSVVTNCHVINPTIEGGENVGGIVGRSYARNDAISKCTVTGGTILGHMFVGGIAGNSEGVIEDCHVKGETHVSYNDSQSEARVGGIVGTNNSGKVVACTANAIVNGEVNALDARYCGGIAGANNGTIIGCASSGQVMGDFGGAIVGESYGDIYGCYANETEAAAMIYKIKKNMNNLTDVTLPTFKACYWKSTAGKPAIASGVESGTVTECEVVSHLGNELSKMNSALDDVRSNTEYEYGDYYEYERNTGDDSDAIPYKATKEQ